MIDYDVLAVKIAGVIGAFVSMQFLQGTFWTKLFLALSGAAFSYFAAPYLSEKIGMPEGLAGFLLGLFGMAIISRAWEFVQTAPIAQIWEQVLARFKKKDA